MTKMMDALVKTEAGKGLKLMQVPVPEPKMGEVLIKIRKTAICGTDVHIYNWDPWAQQHIHPAMTIGHEYVGEIAQLGAHTKGVGVDRDGAFAEYLCIPATNVIPMDKNDIPDDLISFFDAYGNATHTALMFDVVGEDVLITGAGPIGMMAAGICKHNGARNVVITDVNEYRLELARKMGANRPVNVAKEKLEDVMKELGIVEGFDVALEMSGNIQGIYGRKMFETWYKMGAMVQAGLDLTPMVTHRFNYRDFEKGFEAMNSGSSGKVVLDWTK